MLPLAKVQEIKRLLDTGDLSQRKIAKRLEVSRGVVAAIASGRRGIHGRESTNADEEAPQGPPERCPSCGRLVYLPCVCCAAESYLQRKRERESLFKHSDRRRHGRRDEPMG